MSSLLERLPGHLLLFSGIIITGIAAVFIYASFTNVFAWAALLYGVFTAVVGISIVLR